jgi:hypothetical protein
MADRHDQLALDGDVDAGRLRGSIEDDTARQDPPVRHPDPPQPCAAARTTTPTYGFGWT